MQQLQEIYLEANNSTSLDGPTKSVLKVIAAGLDVAGPRGSLSATLERLALLRPQELDDVIVAGRAALWPNKAPLSPATLRNYRSVLTGLAAYAAEKTGRGVPKPLRRLTDGIIKGHKHRKHVDFSELSDAAREDLEQYIAFKTAPLLPPREMGLRGDTWRPITVQGVRARLRSYWTRLERMLGRESTRVERFSPEAYAGVIQEYLAEGERMYREGTQSFPGYQVAKQIAIYLQIGCREYLTAYHEEDLAAIKVACGDDLEGIFNKYREDMDAKHASAQRGKHKTDTTNLTRADLRRAGTLALAEADKVRALYGNKKKWLETQLRYRRCGLFLVMLSSWPMRIRNAAEMQWDRHLKLRADGCWEFRFEGDELKIPRRGWKTNVYQGTFSEGVSEFFSGWRAYLEDTYGAGITRVVPYVFPTVDDLRAGVQELARLSGEEIPLDSFVAPAKAWLAMEEDERRRAAIKAVLDRDLDQLWHLTAAYAYLLGGRLPPQRKMLMRDNRSLREVLESQAFDPLLDPPAGALEAFTAYHEARNLSEETIRTKHIGARHFFRALRWAGATDANPYAAYPEKPRTGHYVTSRLSAKDCLRRDFIALFKEFMGVRITPHRARNILSGDAKRFGQRTGNDAWAIASERLGNHPLTVFHEYNELDVSAGPEFDSEVDL